MPLSKCPFPSITGNDLSKESSTACLFFFFFPFSFLNDPGLLFTAWPIYPGKNKRNKARDDKCW